jgi:type IV pilus assembly protein PilF
MVPTSQFNGAARDTKALRRDAQAALENAKRYRREGLVAQAEASLRRAVALDTESADGATALALLLYRQGKLTEAERMMRQAIGLLPTDEALRRTLGTILEGLGRAEEAADEYAMALALEPDQAMAHAAWGSVLLRQGKLDPAEQQLRQALQIEPDDPAALCDLAEIAYQRDDHAGVVGHLRAAVALLDDTARPPVLRKGGILSRVDLEHTRAAFQRRLDRALAMGALPPGQPAEPAGNQPIQPDPEPSPATAASGRALMAQRVPALGGGAGTDRPDVAVKASDRMRELEARVQAAPGDRYLRRELSTAYLRAGRLAEAKEQLRQVEEMLISRRLRGTAS